MTTSESAPDPTAGERDGDPTYCWAEPDSGHRWEVWPGVDNDSGLPLGYICRWCTREVNEVPRPATPDADDASEPLTAAREWVRGVLLDQRFGASITRREELVDVLAGRIAREAAAATKARAEGAAIGLRAALDPGSFVKRGASELAGEPFTERMDQWQRRAMDEGLARIARGDA